MLNLKKIVKRIRTRLIWLEGGEAGVTSYAACAKAQQIAKDVEALCREVEESSDDR